MIVALLSLLSTEAAACGMPADYDYALAELMAEIDEIEPAAIEEAEEADPLAPIPADQRAPSQPPQQAEPPRPLS